MAFYGEGIPLGLPNLDSIMVAVHIGSNYNMIMPNCNNIIMQAILVDIDAQSYQQLLINYIHLLLKVRKRKTSIPYRWLD